MKNRLLKRLLAFDRQAQEDPAQWIAGVDEAGRGPLAGPVVAAACILIHHEFLTHLDDSKKLTPEQRVFLYREISKHALVGVAIVDEVTIDRLNIFQASRLAMTRAVMALTRTPDFVLVDGRARLDLPLRQKAVVGGDGKSAAVAAASIIAKVCRDAWMVRLDRDYPQYDFKEHKGYATQTHLKRLLEMGPSPVHRKSFGPVRDYFQKEFSYDEVETQP